MRRSQQIRAGDQILRRNVGSTGSFIHTHRHTHTLTHMVISALFFRVFLSLSNDIFITKVMAIVCVCPTSIESKVLLRVTIFLAS